MSQPYAHDELSALEAISLAQKIAAGPMLFQTVCILLRKGVLKALDEAGTAGLSKQELSERCHLSLYGVSVLIDMALSGRVVYQQEDRILLGKVGHFILNDRMTRLNFEFTDHVCYEAMSKLEDSIEQGRPCGLTVFNPDWQTIYPHLSELPDEARNSWFAWDHFYSDVSFKAALKILSKLPLKKINDVGGNTGKFAIQCCQTIPTLSVTIWDLPSQIALARANVEEHHLQERIDFQPVDMLDDKPLPDSEADLWWMSQFLDCFSRAQIVLILGKIKRAMRPEARLAILEPFWDQQQFEAASYSLNAGSLYFTAVANGNSRFYAYQEFTDILAEAGFALEDTHTRLGVSHTLLICKTS